MCFYLWISKVSLEMEREVNRKREGKKMENKILNLL